MPSSIVVPSGMTVIAGPASSDPAPPDGRLSASAPDTLVADVVEGYCTGCHNDRMLRGNLSLVEYDATRPEDRVETTEMMIRKLRAGMMPPAGARRPQGDSLEAMAAALEARIDALAEQSPNPGRRSFQRLNQAEYSRSIRDLLGLEVNLDAYLPSETVSAGFDNIADAQLLSPTLMDGYLTAAAEISRLAVGDSKASPSETTYEVSRYAEQRQRVEGAPYGTRGGISVVHHFPADGEYVLRMSFAHESTGNLFGQTTPYDEQLEISVNGVPVAVLDIDRWMHVSDPNGVNMEAEPIFIRAGPQRITAAFLQNFEGPVEDLMSPHAWSLADKKIGYSHGITSLTHFQDLAIRGPYNPTGVSETPTRARIFTCEPGADDTGAACARSIFERLGTQAYRRPLSEAELDDLVAFYGQGSAEDGFEYGIRLGLQAILASPDFVFRIEEQSPDAAPGAPYRISDLDLASRLSFFLWGGPPDAQLIARASEGALSEGSVLEAEARRMLEDPRSEALSTRFAAQWLRLQDLDKVHPDALAFPDFYEQLAQSMRRETELLFDYVVREDRPVTELLTADYTFANEDLARHYGIPGVSGSSFQRVNLPDPARRGLLGHGSILTLTSHADRTSPVLRGKWVMEVLLGSPPPPPPPDVPDIEATSDVADGRTLTVRERMEAHRASPACTSCHLMMDPIGLALENFDVTGRLRIKDAGLPVNPVGELYDGQVMEGASDLRSALLSHEEAILRSFTENLMAYALGRRVEYYDMPAVRRIVREAGAEDGRMSAFILGVIRSDAFQYSMAEETTSRLPRPAAQEG